MQKIFDFVSSFIDEDGNVKDLDLTKREDYEKVKKLLKMTKDNFSSETGKYSLLAPLFFGLPKENTLDELDNIVDEIYKKSNENTINEQTINESEYKVEQTKTKSDEKTNCVLITPEQEQHLQNIVDRYMNEVIKPVMNLSASDEKNMNLAFFDFARWIYTV